MEKIEDKIIKILENKNITPILSGNPRFLGTIRIYEEYKLEETISELESLFKKYKSYSITTSHVSSCCAPSYEEIRYRIQI